MRIKTFRVLNYKSFKDSGEHVLAPHMNVVVGQNSVGKTALLQALAQRMQASPHWDSDMYRGQADDPVSSVNITIDTNWSELKDDAMMNGWDARFPIPKSWNEKAQAVFTRFASLENITFRLRYGIPRGRSPNWQAPYPSTGLFEDSPDEVRSLRLVPRREQLLFEPLLLEGREDNIAPYLGTSLEKHVYLFDSLRVVESRYGVGKNIALMTNAANLGEVLANFQSRPSEYREYLEIVRKVIPVVKWVSVENVEGNQVELKVWNVEESTRRDDLAVPIKEAGTGIGQVLSILYVVLRSPSSIILIDEPNSFLHPGAAKTLMRVLSEYSNHQFIISTHSPEVIAAADPERLFMLKLIGEKTQIQEVNRNDIDSARQVLWEVGSRFSDLFGSDRVVWVEGPTEAQCFPLIMSAAKKALAAGVVIAPVASVDSLQGKSADMLADMYLNLTRAGASLPATAAFAFDGDKARTTLATKLRRALPAGMLHFLPRWTYENYLIHPAGLTNILNTLPTFQDRAMTKELVTSWIEQNGNDNKYRAIQQPVFSDQWYKAVDGSELLTQLFAELSNAMEKYEKPKHSVQLTRWLLEDDPSALSELQEHVVSLMPSD